MLGYIYSLTDKNTKQPFYIGSSFYPNIRELAHKSGVIRKSLPIYRYISENNIEFELEIIEEIEAENNFELQKWEIYWIHQFRAWEFSLKNSILYLHYNKHNSNNNPFPLRLGSLRGFLEKEAADNERSLHFWINKILDLYVKGKKEKS